MVLDRIEMRKVSEESSDRLSYKNPLNLSKISFSEAPRKKSQRKLRLHVQKNSDSIMLLGVIRP